jgi:cytochrome P450/nitrite reductase/ring-hydroxylating ferredoxin subunit
MNVRPLRASPEVATEAKAEWARAARAEDLKGDGPFALGAGGYDVVLLRGRDGLLAYEGRCPHQGALLGEGELEGAALVCKNHRWRFDVETGARIGGQQCLRSCGVKEEGGEVFVDIAALAKAAEAPATNGTRIRRAADLPGPRALPLVGNSLSLDKQRLHLVLEGWARQYGPAYLLRIGRLPVLVLSDLDVLQSLFRERPDTYRKVSFIEEIFEEMHLNGLFSAEGSAWRPQRRLAVDALSQKNVRAFYPTLVHSAERLRGRWDRAARAGSVLDLNEELKRFTVDVTTQLVFGHDVNTLERDDDDVIQRDLEHVFPALNRRLSALLPYWRYLKLPADRRLDRAVLSLRKWVDGRIAETRKTLELDPTRAERPANFLEAMLVAKDESGRPFSNEALFGNALTMLLAGEDTTAYTMSWTIHQLCEEPRVRAELRAEVDRVLGDDRIPQTMEQVESLKYATAVANESMRLRNVAPFLVFEPLRDVVVGDLAIPRGMGIFVLTRLPSHDDRRFTAADEFRPERWLADAEKPPAHDPSVHVPFGSGPRICPGRSLALVEMRVGLATLYRSFEVERVGQASEVEERMSFTMIPAGLRVRLRNR